MPRNPRSAQHRAHSGGELPRFEHLVAQPVEIRDHVGDVLFNPSRSSLLQLSDASSHLSIPEQASRVDLGGVAASVIAGLGIRAVRRLPSGETVTEPFPALIFEDRHDGKLLQFVRRSHNKGGDISTAVLRAASAAVRSEWVRGSEWVSSGAPPMFRTMLNFPS